MDYMPRTKKTMILFGLWPPENKDRFYELRQWINIALLSYYVIGVIIYPFAVIQDAKIPIIVKIQSFALLACLCTFMYNYVCTYYFRQGFMDLFEKMQNFDNYGMPSNADKVSKFIDYVSIALIIYCIFGSSVIILIPLVTISDCKRYNEVHNITLMCGYASPMKYPYNINFDISYYLHLVIELYGALTLSSKGVIFFGLGMGLFEAVILRLNHLILKLKEVYGDDDISAQKSRLRLCIMYHIHIIDLADQVNECYCWITMPCLVSYNVIIGLNLLAVLNGPTIMSIVLTIGWSGALFAGCITGERVMTTSMAVGEAAYDIKWYSDTRLRRDIQLMILRSEKPLKMKCGNFGELSFVSFKKIMGGAYTYATMRSGLQENKT